MNDTISHASLASRLRNQFFLLRHGESEANVARIVCGSPEVGTAKYGLTPRGRDQVGESVTANQDTLRNVDAIITSDFLRATETAAIAATLLGVSVTQNVGLRERYFGRWEGESNRNYADVWQQDAKDPDHEIGGVESVRAVARRMWDAVQAVDQSDQGHTFLMVSHGDPLQILITAAGGHDLRRHRQIVPIPTAGLRSLGDSRRDTVRQD